MILSLQESMLWPNISNVLKLWVLSVVFQVRMDHLDYHFESLVAEFKSVIPRMTKCLLYPPQREACGNRGILSTIYFLITLQEKTWLCILDLAPDTKEILFTVLTDR